MSEEKKNTDSQEQLKHVDVLIVGAGISGIASAYHLSTQCPDKRFLILDNQDTFGGTWNTHRYPGLRSDSDLYTFGYRFKAWKGAPIATADKIRNYLGEVIEENGLDQYIRYKHVVNTASWSSEKQLWTVTATDNHNKQTRTFTCQFLWMCQGYYRHAEGYTPDWPDMKHFKGSIVHPQQWPEELDYKNKKVVVIGSGATAATLIPAMADDTSHITMLQRSPTYFLARANNNELADTLRQLDVNEDWIHEITRRKILFDQAMFTRQALSNPEEVKQELIAVVRDMLGPDFDVEKHFTPNYAPWTQRIAFLPDGDLFRAIREGQASVVTDEIEHFTDNGIALKSGETLTADIIVTATGFNLCALGDIQFDIDGKPLDFAETVAYRGMMFTGVPNMLWVCGYFRASWTLRAELIADFVCRLLNHMQKNGHSSVTPTLRPEDANMEILPWADLNNFNPGYVIRGSHLLPKRGNKPEWQLSQDYWAEKEAFPKIDFDDDVFNYHRS